MRAQHRGRSPIRPADALAKLGIWRLEALGDACAQLLARPPAEVQESATEARSRVAARFDLRAWTERMMERYERCFEGLRPG